MVEGTQREAKERKKTTTANLPDEQEQPVVDWLKNEGHDLLYNKSYKDYKDTAQRDSVWTVQSDCVVTMGPLKQ